MHKFGSEISHHKNLLRDHIRKTRLEHSQRLAKTEAAFTQNILNICDSSVQTVAAYLPTPSEPPLRAALTELNRRGVEVLVPVVERKRTLSWVRWSADLKHPVSAFGIEEPEGERYSNEHFFAADLHLIPALAYDVHGNRLGQGGAFYDTLLTQVDLTSPSYVGVVFEHEIKDAVPAEPHDAQLHFVLTEKGLRSFNLPQ